MTVHKRAHLVLPWGVVEFLHLHEQAFAQVASAAAAEDQQPAEKNGDIMILYTSDIHCGVDQGFGLVGLKQVRDTLETQGYTTILVDDGN